jgi:predicted metal-dependent hydrolase
MPLLNSRVNINMQQIKLGDIPVEVELKNIKNVHLSVYPPTGRVHISAPLRLDLDTIRIFAITKLGWIKKQQSKLRSQDRETPREYINRESHYYLGKRYLLKISERDDPPKVLLKHRSIEMFIRPDTGLVKRREILDEWYRQRLKEIVPPYIQKWEPIIKVKVGEFAVKKMKTRWGSCNSKAGRIWLNLELSKKPLQCIEYVVVHEMVHLKEKKHGEIFTAYMDKFLPMWKSYREELNRHPLRHENWEY